MKLQDILGNRNIVFVGLMGAGKTAIGRRLSQMQDLPFIDSDHEIESVSRMTVPELFETYGETEFRSLEQRVIERLLRQGGQIVSTGGGAFMNEATRGNIARRGVSVWLKADLDLLLSRVARNKDRPLLRNDDPRGVLQRLMQERHPVYRTADLTVKTRDVRREIIAMEVVDKVVAHLKNRQQDILQ